MPTTTERSLKLLHRFVGTWTTEATHPAFDGVVHGTVIVEWLEGEQFLIHRARTDHPDFPDSISIIGFADRDRADDAADGERLLSMHYFDSRGVFRVYDASIDETALRLGRDSPGFSQRFTGTFSSDGNTIVGRWQLNEDKGWHDDLEITYRRSA